MNKYYIDYPRDFANEYDVYVAADAETERELLRYLGSGAQRITRQEAVRLGWTRPREATRTGEQWYGGFVGGAIWNYNVSDVLREAQRRTKEILAEAKQNAADMQFHRNLLDRNLVD